MCTNICDPLTPPNIGAKHREDVSRPATGPRRVPRGGAGRKASGNTDVPAAETDPEEGGSREREQGSEADRRPPGCSTDQSKLSAICDFQM